MFIRLLRAMRLKFHDVDILNQISPSGRKPKTDPEKVIDPGPQPQLEGARLFVKYVFPRQHGLPNPFIVSTENTVPFYNREIEAAISVRRSFEDSIGACQLPILDTRVD